MSTDGNHGPRHGQNHGRKSTTTEVVRIQHFASFWIAKRLYGVDILQVREINTETAFTPIFHAPPQVRGYVNIRGQIHLVIDPRLPLGLPEDTNTKGKQLMIFKPTVAESFALLVDKVGDILEVGADRIESVDGATAKTCCTGVVKLEQHLMEVLNPVAFLALSA